MNKKQNRYLKVFTTMFYLSAFTFGGGYVIISLMHAKFVEELEWLDEDEMLNLAAIAQSTPGAVAVNAAILVGYKVAGIFGALISIIGTVLPPLIIISTISFFYDAFRTNLIVSAVLKGMQAGVAAVIFDVVMNLSGNIFKNKEYLSVIVMILAFVATYFYGVNVIYIILCCATIGIVTAWIGLRKELK
ncbi:MAG: chromate transporter [Eubacteriales bacterium]